MTGAGPQGSTAQGSTAQGSTAQGSTAQGRALAAALGLEPLALEGGLFRRTFTGGGATAILFMLIGDDFSALHRLPGDEVYFHHGGSPLRMLLIEPDGRHHEVMLGSAVAAGQQPQVHVPARWWQGSSPDGPWSLVSTVVSPGFDWHDFALGARDELTALAPAAAGRIRDLTRDTSEAPSPH